MLKYNQTILSSWIWYDICNIYLRTLQFMELAFSILEIITNLIMRMVNNKCVANKNNRCTVNFGIFTYFKLNRINTIMASVQLFLGKNKYIFLYICYSQHDTCNVSHSYDCISSYIIVRFISGQWVRPVLYIISMNRFMQLCFPRYGILQQ